MEWSLGHGGSFEWMTSIWLTHRPTDRTTRHHTATYHNTSRQLVPVPGSHLNGMPHISVQLIHYTLPWTTSLSLSIPLKTHFVRSSLARPHVALGRHSQSRDINKLDCHAFTSNRWATIPDNNTISPSATMPCRLGEKDGEQAGDNHRRKNGRVVRWNDWKSLMRIQRKKMYF